MHRIKALFLASSLLATSAIGAQAEPNVVASIKPVHSLVAAVMEGVGEPGLIVDGASSPHNFSLKPSQAQMLESANIVFWIGHELETFLEKPLETVGKNAKSVELFEAHGLTKLNFREGGPFEKHGHDDHDEHEGQDDHADHNDHDHDKKAESDHDHDHDHEKKAEGDHDHDHDDHDHDKKAEADHDDHDHGEEGHEGHAHGEHDAHIWLDPANARAMVHEIEEALVAADPENAAKYEANAKAVMARLDSMISEVNAELKPVSDKGFIVFHDAYQYFENRFGMKAAGSITVSPETIPGAQRIKEIRERVEHLGATCVFAEPQFEPKLVATVIEGTQAKSGIIDPLGAGIDNGPDLYFKLIRNMAASMKSCLSG